MPGEFMATTDIRSLSNELKTRANMDVYGNQVNIDFWDWLSMLGRDYIVQLGTEDAPIDSTTSIDDALVWAVVDVPSGVSIAILEAGVNVVDFTTGTLANVMLEIDKAKVRYVSGGTAFTPLNLRTGEANSSGVAAYVGTDVTVAAKTAGGSLEIARSAISNDAVATQTAQENNNFLWRPERYIPILDGPASFLLHFGAATADVTGYGQVKFAELT